MKLIIFNLKAYLNVKDSVKVSRAISKIRTEHEVLIAPPALSMCEVSKMRMEKNVRLCAQNFDYAQARGAHTGDILLDDLKELGCSYALVGHSEVRHRQAPMVGESDQLISKKVRLCLERGLTPVLCFGESGEERDAGTTDRVITRQLKSAFSEVSDRADVVIAYEPVWALSSVKGAKSCSLEDIARIRELAKKVIGDKTSYRFLYGGSVNGDNIKTYLSDRTIEGAVIGRAGTEIKSIENIAAVLGSE